MKGFLKKHLRTGVALIVMSAMFSSSVQAEIKTGQIDTSFNVDSPVLTVSIPTRVRLHLNQAFSIDSIANGGFVKAGDYKQLPLYSDTIKISNATMRTDAKAGVPVVATLYAALKPSDSVKVVYDEDIVKTTSGEKNVFVNLIGEPQLKKTEGSNFTGDVYEVTGDGVGGTRSVGTVTTAGDGGGRAIVTKYNSMMQITIAGPAVGVSSSGEATPTYGGFALAGLANVLADWKDDDLGVELYYKIKAVNTSYNADETMALATDTSGSKMVLAENETHEAGAPSYMMLDAIKAAEGLSTIPANAAKKENGIIKISTDQTKSVYLAFKGIDPTLTATTVGYSFTDETGVRWDYEIPKEEYKTANLYCDDQEPYGNDRILYINILKAAHNRVYMADLGKKKGADQDVKFFVVFSDGSVYFQDVVFEKDA